MLLSLLSAALEARTAYFDARHEAAFRLFNGFVEGCPDLVLDLYGRSLLIHNYAKDPADGEPLVAQAAEWAVAQFSWLEALVVKTRRGETAVDRNGILIHGSKPDRWIREHGVRYAIDLLMNRDASLYLDTRTLRRWALDQLSGTAVLNTFAYTGSLGVAAAAAGASRVVHLDLNKQFLNVAKTSYTLNGFPIAKKDFQTGDFWPYVNQLKRAGERFDCIFLDPPFFSSTSKGKVDLTHNTTRLINKLRPITAHGGRIVAINNALFFSGAEYIAALQSLCDDRYLTLEALIPVADDFTAVPENRRLSPITDPAPFNHSTKIAVLRVRHS